MNQTSKPVRELLEIQPRYRGFIGTLVVPAYEYTVAGAGSADGTFRVPTQNVPLFVVDGLTPDTARGDLCVYTKGQHRDDIHFTGYSIRLADLAKFVSEGAARLNDAGLDHVGWALKLRGQTAYEMRRYWVAQADLFHRPF